MQEIQKKVSKSIKLSFSLFTTNNRDLASIKTKKHQMYDHDLFLPESA